METPITQTIYADVMENTINYSILIEISFDYI
jgi:hypothetical protein